MTYQRKTWTEKYHNGKTAKVVINRKKYADVRAGATLLVPTPEIVDAYLRHIPEGKSVTLSQLRKDLAAENNAEICCPVTTGIFIRIIAEKSYEELQSGIDLELVSPFWRIIQEHDPISRKLTFGTEFIHHQRLAEGF